VSTNIPKNEKPQAEVDIAAEFAELGKKLRDTVEAAWASQERQKVQKEVQEGLIKLRDELDKAAKSLRDSEPGVKVETEVKKVREDLETGKVADDVRVGIVSGLRGLGAALDKLADTFTPAEEAAKAKASKK
jgi:hypothetical protein